MLAAWTSTTTSPGPAFGSGASPRRSTSGPPCFVNSTACIVSSWFSLQLQKLDQQRAHPLRLLLLHPMAGTIDQMATQNPPARTLLHPLEIAGTLVGPPIAFSRYEYRGHVNGSAGEQLQFAGGSGFRPAPVPLQSTLEPGPLVHGAVDRELALRQPAACCDLGGRRHLGRYGFRHVLVQVHNVVGRHLGQLARGPGLQRVWFVVGPICALVVKIAAQKGVDTLRAVMHVGIGRPGRVIPLIVLARPIQLRQLLMDIGSWGILLLRTVCGVERQWRWPGERRAHQRNGMEHIGSDERAPRRNRRSEIVPRDQRDVVIPKSRNETKGIPNRV